MNLIKILSVLILLFTFTSCSFWFNGRKCTTADVSYGPADFKVNLTKYSSEEKAQKSLMILPQSGGASFIDQNYAKQFCANGYDVYIVNSWSNDKEIKIDFYGKAQKAISLILAQVHTPFIGLLGTSSGGLHTGVAANTQTKIDSFFIVAGGVPTLDPLKLGELFKTKDIGMAITSKEAYKNQLRLKEFLKPKKLITVSYDTYWGVLNTWLFHSDEILAFFDDSFASRKM